jgi:hypothetical protein
LEKADILEMAVKHLESLHKQQAAMASFTDKYRAGFNECASEVNRFPGLESTVRKRLVAHLNQCVTSGWSSTTTATGSANASSNELAAAAAQQQQQQQQNLHLQILPSSQEHSPLVGRHTSNGIYLSAGGAQTGVQLVPTRLPNGDLALILPSVSASIHHIFHEILDQILQFAACLREVGESVDFHQPSRALGVHHEIKSEQLESVRQRLEVDAHAPRRSFEDLACSVADLLEHIFPPVGRLRLQIRKSGRQRPKSVHAAFALASLKACVRQVSAQVWLSLFSGWWRVGFASEESKHGLVDKDLERTNSEHVGANMEFAAC